VSAPRWARHLAVAAVILVGLVAAIASYSHMHQLARHAGEGWRAVLLPLSVDGMLVAASLVLLVRRRAGQPGGVLPWFALVLGLAASLAANIAAAEPTLVGRLVAGWPPVAFGLAYELLLGLMRPVVGTQIVSTRADAREGEPEGITPGDPLLRAEPEKATHLAGTPGGDQVASQPGADLVDQARYLVAAGEAEGRKVGRASLARQLGCTEHQARQVLRQLDAERRPSLRAVGGEQS
jgi:hypothetical protein